MDTRHVHLPTYGDSDVVKRLRSYNFEEIIDFLVVDEVTVCNTFLNDGLRRRVEKLLLVGNVFVWRFTD